MQPQIYIPNKVKDDFVRLASLDDLEIRREVARVVATLDLFEDEMRTAPNWNIDRYEDGYILSKSGVGGKLFWRLHPIHHHCIGLLELRNIDVYVLDMVSSETIRSMVLRAIAAELEKNVQKPS